MEAHIEGKRGQTRGFEVDLTRVRVLYDHKNSVGLDSIQYFDEKTNAFCGNGAEKDASAKRVKRTSEPGRIKLVVYIVQRDCRIEDNWAMIYALQRALDSAAENASLVVAYSFETVRHLLNTNQIIFQLKAVHELGSTLEREYGINFAFFETHAALCDGITRILKAKHGAGGCLCVLDFMPLKPYLELGEKLIDHLQNKVSHEIAADANLCVHQIDAHNIVPVWRASDKQEYMAKTIRAKITSQLARYLKELPSVLAKAKQSYKQYIPGFSAVLQHSPTQLALDLISKHEASNEIPYKENNLFKPTQKAATGALESFVLKRLAGYATLRNDPANNHLSQLSPYLHSGVLFAGRCVLEVEDTHHHQNQNQNQSQNQATAGAKSADSQSFIEELVVRRELSDNFCFYNKHHDSYLGAPMWARTSLDEHRADKRHHVYELAELEQAKTHDDLWNTAQIQMVAEGKMHGYMRMYWAKKILEWTKTPEDAFKFGIYLNDKYSLDGADPNGNVGILWSIAGLHDRGWAEREVFGKVRYMNYEGCRRKFNIAKYIQTYKSLLK